MSAVNIFSFQPGPVDFERLQKAYTEWSCLRFEMRRMVSSDDMSCEACGPEPQLIHLDGNAKLYRYRSSGSGDTSSAYHLGTFIERKEDVDAHVDKTKDVTKVNHQWKAAPTDIGDYYQRARLRYHITMLTCVSVPLSGKHVVLLHKSQNESCIDTIFKILCMPLLSREGMRPRSIIFFQTSNRCGISAWAAGRNDTGRVPSKRSQDETGLIVATCRHSVALGGVNMYRGELFAYSHFLHQKRFPSVHYFASDIVCKYWPWTQRVASRFPEHGTGHTKPFLSVMHATGHAYYCQVWIFLESYQYRCLYLSLICVFNY